MEIDNRGFLKGTSFVHSHWQFSRITLWKGFNFKILYSKLNKISNILNKFEQVLCQPKKIMVLRMAFLRRDKMPEFANPFSVLDTDKKLTPENWSQPNLKSFSSICNWLNPSTMNWREKCSRTLRTRSGWKKLETLLSHGMRATERLISLTHRPLYPILQT